MSPNTMPESKETCTASRMTATMMSDRQSVTTLHTSRVRFGCVARAWANMAKIRKVIDPSEKVHIHPMKVKRLVKYHSVLGIMKLKGAKHVSVVPVNTSHVNGQDAVARRREAASM